MTILLKTPAPIQTAGRLPWLASLSWYLHEQGYASADQNAILISVMDYGSLEPAVSRLLLDSEDYAEADQVFTDSQPPIPQDDPVWDDDDTWELGPAIPPGTVLSPPELEELEEELQSVGLEELAASSKINWLEWRRNLPPRHGFVLRSDSELPDETDFPF